MLLEDSILVLVDLSDAAFVVQNRTDDAAEEEKHEKRERTLLSMPSMHRERVADSQESRRARVYGALNEYMVNKDH